MDAVYQVKRYEVAKPKAISKVILSDVNKVINELEYEEDQLSLMIAIWSIVRPSEIFGLDFKHDLGDKLLFEQAWKDTDKVLGPVKNGIPRYSPIAPQLRIGLMITMNTLETKVYHISRLTHLSDLLEDIQKEQLEIILKKQ